MRVCITISYNGALYLGSQTQTQTSNTIFNQIQNVLKEINIDSNPQTGGRTDKGVHATGQTFHIDIPEYWHNLKKLKETLNKMLPKSIYIKKIIKVQNDFHARYGAKSRVYRYIIKKSKSNPFENDLVSFYENINFEIIQKNIKLFEGEFNFINFMKTGSEVNSTIREIYKTYAYKHKDFFVLYFEANGFLRSQIRLMVGALLSLDDTQIKEQLLSKKIHKIKPAKANGLYLAKIKY
ncbi:MAG: tRNA pseudouridine(38-40) synthase TruA [Sulfurimonas sp.]|nr:tRNA pseudouridine(38-40) synthase TruA [Sulfurimonas sp.]